jgi:hypothetical protein
MRRRTRGVLLAVSLAVLAVATATAAFAGDNDSGFKTEQASMLTCPSCGDDVVPIITVGETMPGGYRFEAIPDGISLRARGNGRVDLYVNHETSTVAFPYVAAAPTAANSQNDFDNSQVSLLGLNQHSKGVLFGRYAIASSQNYQRFCSNYLATAKEGFDREILFTNEEAQDWVRRSGTAWDQLIPAGTPGAEQTGVVVAHDVRTGMTKTVYGMGRHNHENDVAIPGYDDVVVLSGDDTFSTTPPSSQLYFYKAADADAVWNDEGTLYAFAADDGALYNDYFDIQPGTVVTGHFIPVPKMIATGKKADGSELLSTDFPGMAAPPSSIPNGPQWVLDQWGNAANNAMGKNVFDFIRIEDTAYDKRPGKSNVVYLADSGRGTAGASNPASVSTNGRVWKLELDPIDPLGEAKLSILVQGDDNPVKTVGEIHQPDNVETTLAGSLLVQEDPGSSQQFAPPFDQPGATTARIWRYDLNADTMAPVASVNQSADEGPTDVDPSGLSAWGAWESSGIVDASSIWGPGWFLVDVQAHTLWVEKADGPDVLAPEGPDWTYKREGGQLLAIRIPGA